MQRIRLILAFGLACLTAGLAAQDVRVFGVVKKTGTEFSLECSELPLHAKAGLLDRFVGRIVEIAGRNTGTMAKPNIAVTRITQARHRFTIGGDSRIGHRLDLLIESPGSSHAFLFVSNRTGFVPLRPFSPRLSGTFLLDPTFFFYLSSQHLKNGEYKARYEIPRLTALIGFKFHAQAAVFASPDLTYINGACVTLRAR